MLNRTKSRRKRTLRYKGGASAGSAAAKAKSNATLSRLREDTRLKGNRFRKLNESYRLSHTLGPAGNEARKKRLSALREASTAPKSQVMERSGGRR